MLLLKHLWNCFLEMLGVNIGTTVIKVYDDIPYECILILEEGTFTANTTTLVDLEQSTSDGKIVRKYSEDVVLQIDISGTNANQVGTVIISIAYYVPAIGKAPQYNQQMQINIPINGITLMQRQFIITPPTIYFDVGKVQIVSVQDCWVRVITHCGHKSVDASKWRN